jgi:hypothetical protein
MEMPEPKYDVFISHSSQDREWVQEFTSALKDAGAAVWSDQEILPGEDWQARIETALRESRTLVVVLGPGSQESPSTMFEVGAAMADRKRIIPVILADDAEPESAPKMLRRYQPLREPSAQKAGERVAEVIRQAAAETQDLV